MDGSPPETSSSLTIGDIYYVLFKHKWKIIGFTLVGFLGAFCVVRLMTETVYRSDAKLFIRYVQETGAPLPVTDESQIKSTDLRGETIMNSELEILTSMDLARQVAAALGAETVLRAYGGGSDTDAAANIIHRGISARADRSSRVVNVGFSHPDPTVVQPALKMFISEYLKKHMEVHMTSGLLDDMLSQETQMLRSHLVRTEEELLKAQDRAGIVSLDETKRAYAEQISRVRQQISDTTGEIAERTAMLQELEKDLTSEQKIPTATLQEYRSAVALLDTLAQKQQERLTTFSGDGLILANLRQRIAESTAVKERLEEQYPQLRAYNDVVMRGGTAPMTPRALAQEERSKLTALSIRLKALHEHMERVRKEARDLSAVEMSITDLQRRKDLQESQYRYFSSSLEKTRINETLGNGRVSNITIIQAPTQPFRDTKQPNKQAAGLAIGGIGIGLALAFGLELFLDQTVRRPGEIESLLGLPLFFSIPNIRGGLGFRGSPIARLQRPAGAVENGQAGPVPQQLVSYFDALRDRLVFFFEIRALTKKPKLVAVTSCGDKSGVSTVAAGLAAALSKTGEGNVLLVDMNMEQHAPYHFRNGTIQVGLDELLDGQHRDDALIQHNLYAVPHATGTERLTRILPKRFTDMIPRLRASEYDYIIFDMPAVNQLSVTPQLARFMDMVFLLVESEKTNRDAVKRASSLLTQASCTLGIIVNRTRNYLPKALLQEV